MKEGRRKTGRRTEKKGHIQECPCITLKLPAIANLKLFTVGAFLFPFPIIAFSSVHLFIVSMKTLIRKQIPNENSSPNVTNSKQTIVFEQVGVSSSEFIIFFATFSLFLRISGSGGGRLLAFSLLRREKIGAERAVAVAVVAPVQKEFEGRLQW